MCIQSDNHLLHLSVGQVQGHLYRESSGMHHQEVLRRAWLLTAAASKGRLLGEGLVHGQWD